MVASINDILEWGYLMCVHHCSHCHTALPLSLEFHTGHQDTKQIISFWTGVIYKYLVAFCLPWASFTEFCRMNRILKVFFLYFWDLSYPELLILWLYQEGIEMGN